MTKTVSLNLRVRPEFKEMLARLAAAESRTITSYIEWLVKLDACRQQASPVTNEVTPWPQF